MKITDKDTGEASHLPWDAAMSALASGGSEQHPDDKPTMENRGPDVPAAQSPAPGTEPRTPLLVSEVSGIPNMVGTGFVPGGIMTGMMPDQSPPFVPVEPVTFSEDGQLVSESAKREADEKAAAEQAERDRLAAGEEPKEPTPEEILRAQEEDAARVAAERKKNKATQ